MNEKIFVFIILQLLAMLHQGYSIKCYECVHNSHRMKKYDRYIYPCIEFDNSDNYIRDCPGASLCIYQVITLALKTEEIQVHTMDGCTPNTTDESRYEEAELAQEGCIRHVSSYSPTTAEYCYCANDLCNSGQKNVRGNLNFILLLLTTIYFQLNS